MTKLQEWYEIEVASVRTLRDELRVRAHLFKADVRDEWAKVEHRLDIIESEVMRFGKDAKEPLGEARLAAKALLVEARQAIERIRYRSSLESTNTP